MAHKNTGWIQVIFWCVLSAAAVHGADPDLRGLRPKGGQRGTEVEVTLYGQRLQAPQDILFHAPGIQVLGVENQGDDGKAVKAKLRIAADSPLGEHPFRLRTATGLSDLHTFFVGPFPTVDEQEPNNDFAAPQKIPLNVTVAGVVKNEDVDYYLVEAKKGQRITAEIEALRLGETLFDPYVAILDAKRFELSAADDTALLRQDAYASAVAPEDGTYVVQVRETSYGGSDECGYRLHVGTFPRPRAVYPAGGQTGEQLTVQFIGDVAGDFGTTLKLPDRPQELPVFAEQNGTVAPSPNPVRVSSFPNALEAEPNNDRNTATKYGAAAPVALNGIIATPGDTDWFTFAGKKGQALEVRAFARQIGSPLDSVVDLYGPDGNRVAGNDDAAGLDSNFNYRIPADGDYSLAVRDHLGKGGPAYTYRVEVTTAEPSLSVNLPVFNKDTQERYTVVVPRGNRYAALVATQTEGFDGDVTLQWGPLPPGITAQTPPVSADSKQVPVLFEAAGDAPLGGALVELSARPADASKNITGTFRQVVNLVRGQPNDTPYYSVTLDRVAVAVAEPAPFEIELVQPKAALVQTGAMDLKVVAKRANGFDGPIRLRMLYNPPGVQAAGQIEIPQGQDTAFYNVTANPGAPTCTWKIAVIGAANVGGNLWVSSRFVDLAVAEPYIAGKLEEMVATEQGKATEIVCKLEPKRPFEGKAKIRLLGLPPRVATDEREISKDSQEVVFPLRLEDQAPTGKHKSLFCSLEVTDNGETIRQTVGNVATLRIDPPPKKPEQPAPVAAAAPQLVELKPEKRLSRLEQLRLEQEQRAKGGMQ